MTTAESIPGAPRQGGLRFLYVAAALVIVCAGLKAAQEIVVQFLLAVFLALICLPAMHGMARLGVPAALRVLGVLTGVLVGMVLVSMLVGQSVSGFERSAPGYKASLQKLATQWDERLEGWNIDLPWLTGEEDEDPAPAAGAGGEPASAGTADTEGGTDKAGMPSKVIDYALGVLSTLGSLAGKGMMILLLLVFLLAESPGFQNKIRAATRGDDRVQSRLDDIAHRINRYFAIKTAVSALTGVTAGVVLWMLGVDFPILWGLAAFLLNFVPNIGSILAAVPPVLISLVQPDGSAGLALGVIGLYLGINMFYGNVLETRWMGKGLDLSTFVVFASLIFWGWLLGPIGMLLSTPLTAALRIAMASFDDTRPVAVLLGGGVEPEPRAAPSA